MTGKKVIAICQSGGVFETNVDGALSYKGGDAHAMEIDDDMTYNDFWTEIEEMFDCNPGATSLKYFIPGNCKTLISISNDKDLKRLIKFHGNSNTVEIYVIADEAIAQDASNMLASRSSRTTLLQAVVPVNAASHVLEDVADETSPHILIDASFDAVDDIVIVDDHADLPTKIPSHLPLGFLGSGEEKHAKAAQQWQNSITGVGQRFNNVNEFREALRKYAIAHQFAFRYKKNDSHRVTVKCKAEGCPWRIHASRLSTTQLICIKKMNPTHTCEGAVTSGYQATRSWVASIIKEKLKAFPNYKPKDIVNDIKQEYGIQLNYFQAWRGKEIAKEQLQGSYKEAYGQLPSFCEKLMESNPGSYATFSTKDDSSFHRLFVAFHASLLGFQQGCRPLLFLDSLSVKSRYEGTLLAATSVDGDDGVFPVAFAIIDLETEENWHWFLVQLKSALSTLRGATIIADREKGIKESISDVFQSDDVHHGYCLRHLSDQLMRDLKGQFSHEVKRLIVEDFFAAAYSLRPEGFERYIESIKSISIEAYNWVLHSEPTHWANAFFQGARYNHMTSNFGGIFYTWVSDAYELPITQMVESVRGKVSDLMYARQETSSQWMSRLTPSMKDKVESERLKVRHLQVLLTAGDKFEVRDESIEVVDINCWECSCREWQLMGLPCRHAIAVICCLRRDLYDFCSRYFTTDSYRLAYSESVNPIVNSEGSMQKDVSLGAVTVTPPLTRRPPGRPTAKKIGSEGVVKRQLQCSRCKGSGHNKSTCKEFLVDC